MQAQILAHKHQAREKHKFSYNLKTVEVKFEVGNWVLLKAPTMAGKFINRWNTSKKLL